ncbi:hypothetical protein [Burkholderia savannae]|uniref:hypothetical protein n=1 Tax=Burkholderia savannae TaxID=1637837 RepID=UPI0012F488EA|nr:hypothetical protein [Burkholderia savannae]
MLPIATQRRGPSIRTAHDGAVKRKATHASGRARTRWSNGSIALERRSRRAQFEPNARQAQCTQCALAPRDVTPRAARPTALAFSGKPRRSISSTMSAMQSCGDACATLPSSFATMPMQRPRYGLRIERRFAVCGLRFAVCGLRFAVCGLRFAVCGWRLAVGGSRFAVRGSRFAVRGSRFANTWRKRRGYVHGKRQRIEHACRDEPVRCIDRARHKAHISASIAAIRRLSARLIDTLERRARLRRSSVSGSCASGRRRLDTQTSRPGNGNCGEIESGCASPACFTQ